MEMNDIKAENEKNDPKIQLPKYDAEPEWYRNMWKIYNFRFYLE